MSKIIILRGKAATGKTLLSNTISEKLKILVIRNDDIYDIVAANYDLDFKLVKGITYDIIPSIVNTNIKLDNDLILDIGLAHQDYIRQFLDKLDLDNTKVIMFWCVCSDDDIWCERIEERIANPTPNQLFESSSEALEYYDKLNLNTLENEVVIDSAKAFNILVSQVLKHIGS